MDSKLIIITTDCWSRAWFDDLILECSDFRKIKPIYYHLSYSTKAEFNQHIDAFEKFLLIMLDESANSGIQCFAHTCNSMSLLSCVLARNQEISDQFRGTSFATNYVCTNKLACRKLVKTAEGLKALAVYQDEEFLPILRVNRRTEEAVTGFFKPIAAVASQGVFIVDYCKDGAKITNPFYQKEFSFDDYFGCDGIQKMVRTMADSEIPSKKLSEFIKNQEKSAHKAIVGLVEEYVPPSKCRVFSVDGFVKNGKIYPYAISENIYSELEPTVFVGLITPARELDETSKLKIWEFYDATVNDLLAYGLDNQFVDVELFWFVEEKKCEVMEINCRTNANMMPGFQVVYGGLDLEGKRGKGLFDVAVSLLFGDEKNDLEQFDFQNFKPKLTCLALYTQKLPGLPEITHSIDKMCVFYQSEKSCHIYGYGSVDESMNFIKEKCESFYQELKKQ